VEIHPATPERWSDLVSLFERIGPRGGTPVTSHCWCRFWHVRGREYGDTSAATHRACLEEEIRSGSEPGLLAYVEGDAVGWCRLGPRESFARLEHSPRLARVDDEDVWSIVCFYVHPAAKRQGVAGALLAATGPHATRHGAELLEAYPVQPGHPNIDAFTGYLPMFLEAGFEVTREAGRRTIVRRPVSG
jgi:GNAT superfamily N-acetyltransferase